MDIQKWLLHSCIFFPFMSASRRSHIAIAAPICYNADKARIDLILRSKGEPRQRLFLFCAWHLLLDTPHFISLEWHNLTPVPLHAEIDEVHISPLVVACWQYHINGALL